MITITYSVVHVYTCTCIVQGMSSLRSLIPFRLSHLLETSAHVSSDLPCIHYCMLTRNFILLTIGRGAAGSITSASAYAHAQLSSLRRTCAS